MVCPFKYTRHTEDHGGKSVFSGSALPKDKMPLEDYMLLMLLFTTAFLIQTTITHTVVAASLTTQVAARLRATKVFRNPAMGLRTCG